VKSNWRYAMDDLDRHAAPLALTLLEFDLSVCPRVLVMPLG